jgi:hypothetical protein
MDTPSSTHATEPVGGDETKEPSLLAPTHDNMRRASADVILQTIKHRLPRTFPHLKDLSA